MRPHRSQPLYLAFILHRISGLGLALFLPLHFLMLSQALGGAEQLQVGISWTDNWLFKLAEFGLVFGLAVHMFGGLRLMALEFLPWSDRQKSLAAAAVAGSFAVAGTFLLGVISA